MPVSDDRVGLADPAWEITSRPAGSALADRPRQRRPLPTPPADLHDLRRHLQATARLADLDELDAAEHACTAAIEMAGQWRSPGALAAIRSLRCSVLRRRGRLAAAETDGHASAELLAAAGAEPCGDPAALLAARRIAVRLDTGDVAGAEHLVRRFGRDLPDSAGAVALRYARGRLHAAAGRLGEGLADLFACGERLAARGADRPLGVPWRSAVAAVLAATGATEAAARLVAAEVAANRRAGTASALGRSLRIQGAVLDGPDGMAALDEAVRVLARSPRRFEYAEALVDFGLRLTAARRRPQARRVLREGLDLAEQCGSPALAERARTGYTAAGGKPRPPAPR
jgi:tetratricopeptide (TPR) repeat protein